MKHAMMLELMGGELFFAPIGDNSQNILDIGTGIGELSPWRRNNSHNYGLTCELSRHLGDRWLVAFPYSFHSAHNLGSTMGSGVYD